MSDFEKEPDGEQLPEADRSEPSVYSQLERSAEQEPDSVDFNLHHQRLELMPDRVLKKADINHPHGYLNGDTIAEITLPGAAGSTAFEKGKRFALVDFGEDMPERGAEVFIVMPSRASFGRSHSRYGLFGLNHRTGEALADFAELPEGATTIGRNMETNYKLGLISSTNKAREPYVSGTHATITVEGGRIIVTDHSRNGTRMTVPQ